MKKKTKIDNMKKLLEFMKEALLINELKDNYQSGVLNRKKLAHEIIARTKKAKTLLEIIDDSLETAEYENQDMITDCPKVLEVILRLANQDGDKYIIKKVYNRDWLKEEDRPKYEKGKSEDNVSFIIAKREALECIDDNKLLWFGTYMENLLNNGYSIVITVRTLDGVEIMSNYLKGNKNVFRLTEDANDAYDDDDYGWYSDIGCYTFDDELNQAVNAFKKYISTYGGDLEGISADTIVSRTMQLEAKKESKKRIKD